ncbi:ATP-binding protein [Desulfatiglans anilini]|uniref:ATP-binding protein n=1 Tax=Desulfatiglans anilini TaxID=90728 RepID=UPI000415E00F|nr:ATP-binding protein [Desulfatiglans anilini]
MNLSEILLRHRDRIIHEWVERLHGDVSPTYSALPEENLLRTIPAVTDANYAVLTTGDHSKIDAFIEWIGNIRSRAGFSVSEVQKAFELYRTILLPIFAAELETPDLLPAIHRLNDCLSYTLHRFSDHFQALHNAEIKRYAQTLEVKVAERTRQLAESESKYRTLVEKIRDGYFVSRAGRILFANKAFCSMHGYPKKDVLGRPFTDFVAAGSLGKIRWIDEGQPPGRSHGKQYVYNRLHRNGTELPTENTVTLALYEGEAATIGISRDIAERVEIERRVREAEALARIGHLTTSLAHEIRNPLSSVKMSVQMILKNTGFGATDQRRLEILAQQISRLEAIVGDMLDLAKPLRLASAPASIIDAIEMSLEVLEAKLNEKRIHVRKRFGKALPLLAVDREKMEQAIINLLLNAVEAVEAEGRIQLAVRLLRKENAVEVAICDNGPGVSPEDLPYLFDPFFSKKTKGTGLGLANTKRIVEAHGASIHASPAQGGGLCFFMVFPISPGPSAGSDIET